MEGAGNRDRDGAVSSKKKYSKRKRNETGAENYPDLKRIRIGVGNDAIEITVPNIAQNYDENCNLENHAIKFEDVFSIFFTNINGLSTQKINRLKILTENDQFE